MLNSKYKVDMEYGLTFINKKNKDINKGGRNNVFQ